MRIYGVTGRKNSGKTGLMVRLVGEINKRGLSVSTIKHAHHDADIDQPGRDTFHHRNAGATQVILSSPNRWALMHELRGAEEPSLGSLLERLSPVDVVLIEGYKNEGHPKIETWRPETGQELLARVNSTSGFRTKRFRPALRPTRATAPQAAKARVETMDSARRQATSCARVLLTISESVPDGPTTRHMPG